MPIIFTMAVVYRVGPPIEEEIFNAKLNEEKVRKVYFFNYDFYFIGNSRFRKANKSKLNLIQNKEVRFVLLTIVSCFWLIIPERIVTPTDNPFQHQVKKKPMKLHQVNIGYRTLP